MEEALSSPKLWELYPCCILLLLIMLGGPEAAYVGTSFLEF